MKKFSAKNYRKSVEKKREATNYEVDVPSGTTFTLREIDLTPYLSSGQLPTSYIEKMLSMGGKSPEEIKEAMQELTPAERVADLMFLGLVVRAACVSPKIVSNPIKDDELAFEDLDDADIRFIFETAVAKRGAGGDIAEKFPAQS